jgi:GMP synthase-like glutamine amidotransferase
MKPIIIFRHVAHEGAGYLADFLSAQGLSWQLHKIDEGEPLPSSIAHFSGVVLMGGPMSVNDDLPWIAPLLSLIREADALDIPLLGHCLGGQLMSKALGGVVTQNAVKEIGWGEVIVSANTAAQHWFGDIQAFNAFHWHGETFSLPAGATHLLKSAYCENQAWGMGKHLALQTHIEMTPEMVQKWYVEGEAELHEAKNSPAVQQTNTMQAHLRAQCQALNQAAAQVYSVWLQGLKSSH